jgi:hypothetical protein
MELDANVMDELFNRINQLEEENKFLKNRITDLKTEVEKKELNEIIKDDEDDITKEIDKLNDEESTNPILKSDESLQEVNIEFTPFDPVNEVFIAGDFSKWEKLPMKSDGGSSKFIWTGLLLKNYLYYYCFYSQNQPLIDFSKEYTEHPINKSMCNYVTVAPIQGHESEPINIFSQEKDYDKLEGAKNKSKNISNEDEMLIFKKIMKFSNLLKQTYESISTKREEKLAENKHFYE